MKVIIFQDETYQKLIQDFENIVNVAVNSRSKSKLKNDWISEKEAKEILGIKSKSKLQQLRDERLIVFSQHGRIIRYSQKSIENFLDNNIPKY